MVLITTELDKPEKIIPQHISETIQYRSWIEKCRAIK